MQKVEHKGLMGKLAKPFDERFDLTNHLHKTFLKRPVPNCARRYYFCFGGITLFLFVIQVVTGVILTSYYVPSAEKAYASVYYISYNVNYGWLVRSIHHWAANLMVIFIFLHMLRVFVTASYKHPREYNWFVGMILLIITLAFALTGYLLPWDQKAYWGSAAIIRLAEQIPLFGRLIAHTIMGGDTVSGATLIRFFSAHIMVLPGVLSVFLVIHFWMIRRQGISDPL